MTALPDVRRKRTGLILGTTLLALVAIAALSLVGRNALLQYEGAKKVEQPETQPVPTTSVGMLAITDDTNRLAGLALVVSLAGDQPGGYLLPLPTSVDSTLGIGDDRIALTAVFAQDGLEGLGLAVEGALSVTLNAMQVVTPVEAEVLFAPVTPVQATLPRDVRDSVDGTAVVLFPTGATELSAAQVVQVLTAEVTGEPESARRDNINAVWAAIAAGVGNGKTLWTPGAPAATIGDLLTRTFAGAVVSQSFPTVPIPLEFNPKGLDVENIDRAEAVMWLATVAPGSMSAPGLGLTYRIEAPPEYVAEVKAAVAALLSIGANIKSVDFDGPVLAASAALVSTEDAFAVVAADVAIFGTVQVSVNSLPIEGVDVVLQLGSEYLDGVALTVPSGSTTIAGSSTTVLP